MEHPSIRPPIVVLLARTQRGVSTTLRYPNCSIIGRISFISTSCKQTISIPDDVDDDDDDEIVVAVLVFVFVLLVIDVVSCRNNCNIRCFRFVL